MDEFDPADLARELRPTGTNGHQELTQLEYQRLLRQVPAKFRGAIKKKTSEDRSDYIFRLICELIEAGVTRDTIVSVLEPAPMVQDKYGGRDIRAELNRDIDNALAKGVTKKRKKKRTTDDEEPRRKLLTVRADEVEGEETTWLWKNWIPFGEVTILGGRPGNGKSQLTLYFTACVTRGKLKLPGAGDVLIASLEDSVTKTLKPRLVAAGADARRVHVIQGTTSEDGTDLLTLPRDASVLFDAARDVGARLIVIDPLSAALQGGKEYDSHREADVRRVMTPIVNAAQGEDIAVLAVMHMKKKLEEEIMMTLSGSGAFPAIARSVVVFGYHPSQGSRAEDRVLVHAKSNLGPQQSPYDFRMKKTYVEVRRANGNGTKMQPMTRVLPQGYSGIEAEELAMTPKTETGKTDAAVDLLQKYLKPGKKVATAKLVAKAEEQEIAYRTLYRAAKRIGVKMSGSRGRHTKSFWELQG